MVRWWVLALCLAACSRERPPPVVQTAPPAPKEGVVLEAQLPDGPGPFAPSLARLIDPKAHYGSTLADVETCASCHTDIAGQWRKSAHAFASFNNPVYRVAVERLRKDRGEKTSRFCAGCHDVSLLVDGAMEGAIEPTDLRAHAGITCNTCHGIDKARADGNGSWDLDTSPVPMPVDGDHASAVRHKERVGRETLRTAEMCSTCHKAFLDHDTGNAVHLIGQDDATPWARSAFAGSQATRIDDAPLKDCRGCHMPRVPAVLGDPGAKNGTVASHWFLGGHTWLAAMESDPELVERVQAFMKDRVSLDVGGVRHAGRIDLVGANPIGLTPGETATLDVVVRNLDVGHRFPGGVMDAQDTWIEVVLTDAKGKAIAEAGTTENDPTAHEFASYMARADGTQLLERETHEFRASVFNDTIPPRDAAVVGYSFIAPRDGYPLHAALRLRHRSRNLALQKIACADTRSERGRAFGRAGLAKVARAIDACKQQPITDLATTAIALGAVPASGAPTFERRYAYGLGLSHALQEHTGDARAPLVAAIDLATSARDRAIAIGGLALVAAREGRTDETFALAERADAAAKEAGLTTGPHPAMQRARGEVLVATWRLAEAAPLFADVAERSPRDDAAWAEAATTFGSAGDSASALETARKGLLLQPRDGDMLRIQALALPGQAPAQAAFLERRTPDDAPSIRGRCSADVAGCANERIPVHVHAMRVIP